VCSIRVNTCLKKDRCEKRQAPPRNTMKNKLPEVSNLRAVTGRARLRTVRAMIVFLSLIALPLTRALETIPPEKTTGDRTAKPLPPAGQRAFNKSATTETASPGTAKKAARSVVSGVLPPGLAQADKQAAAATAAMPLRSPANSAAGPVSGQASPEDLKNYQKPGGNNAAPSVLVPPVSAPAPGAGKVALGTVTGPASPEALRGYVKPAVLPDAAPEPARAPTSGTVPPAEQRHFQK
jgi:hypothetical protein